MTNAHALNSAGLLAGLGLLLAGCMGGGPSGSPMRAAPTGVEGAWLDALGPMSTFNAGIFQTITTDTGQKLAEGTYVMTGPTSVEIRGTALQRQAPLHVNCLLVSANQMNCTTAENQNFTLNRRA